MENRSWIVSYNINLKDHSGNGFGNTTVTRSDGKIDIELVKQEVYKKVAEELKTSVDNVVITIMSVYETTESK